MSSLHLANPTVNHQLPIEAHLVAQWCRLSGFISGAIVVTLSPIRRDHREVGVGALALGAIFMASVLRV
jgi:hypothetical protein